MGIRWCRWLREEMGEAAGVVNPRVREERDDGVGVVDRLRKALIDKAVLLGQLVHPGASAAGIGPWDPTVSS